MSADRERRSCKACKRGYSGTGGCRRVKARDEGGWRCSLTGHDEVGLVWCCLIEMGMQVVGLKLRHDEDRRACLIIVW